MQFLKTCMEENIPMAPMFAGSFRHVYTNHAPGKEIWLKENCMDYIEEMIVHNESEDKPL